MVNFTALLLPALLASATHAAYTWTKCTNAERCIAAKAPNGSTAGGKAGAQPGSRFSYVGGYVFAVDTCSGYSSDRAQGCWYSHDKDGLFISPTGYMRTAHDCNLVGVLSKSADVGVTYWWLHKGGDRCLPDSVGTEVYDVQACYAGDQ
ncbi:hypothetical protein MPH_12419 [Macrophomina phaseolina MS6]|uniref:Uncharacterized protein n=1 Tax=Macrophomina phaseolina (strain MS6) TaxID=1126212 RepID=K2QL98_MACPH|nr:hypothetical protein MPH_12419 [Macrophomina phaseolina MS6]